MHDSELKVLISESDIARRVSELAEQIARDQAQARELVLVGVLKGAFIFLADLARRISIPHSVEFMALSSYEDGAEASGSVRLVMDMRKSIEGKHVLIVEDIVDTGRTLHFLTDLLMTRRPASIKTCVLVRKRDRIEIDTPIDYLGFDIPDVWVVGYGLDYAERNRTLPYVASMEANG